MEVIRFQLEGVLNSFRIPFFKNYHKTLLAPPKTAVIGFIVNIAGGWQRDYFYLLNSRKIQVSVVIENLAGKGKELWSYRSLEKKNRGKKIIRREKLLSPSYRIYLYLEREVGEWKEKIWEALQNPLRPPALGMDDELVKIGEVSRLNLLPTFSNRIDSVAMVGEPNYKVFLIPQKENLPVELPTPHLLPVEFEAYRENTRIPKEKRRELFQIEGLNCQLEIEGEGYRDPELGYTLYFY